MPDQKVSILYIDDDSALGRLVQRACGRRGYDLVHELDVRSGIERLRSGKFNIVVLDHELRGETGLDFLKAMEGEELRPPVVYVTASTEADVAVKALKAGASDYVIKSAAGDFLDLLFNSIEPSLERARLERAKLLAEQQVREARDRAELMLREINHRVANSLSLVSSLVRLQSSLVSDDNALAALAETEARIKAIAGVHRRLYTSTDMVRVALDEYVRDLVDDLKASLGAVGTANTIEVVTEPVAVTTDKAVSIGVALTELVTNAVKYAYTAAHPGPIRISLRKLASDRAAIHVEDDGTGWTGTGHAQGTGLGTKIVKAMMGALGSKLDYLPGAGTRASFEFEVISPEPVESLRSAAPH